MLHSGDVDGAAARQAIMSQISCGEVESIESSEDTPSAHKLFMAMNGTTPACAYDPDLKLSTLGQLDSLLLAANVDKAKIMAATATADGLHSMHARIAAEAEYTVTGEIWLDPGRKAHWPAANMLFSPELLSFTLINNAMYRLAKGGELDETSDTFSAADVTSVLSKHLESRKPGTFMQSMLWWRNKHLGEIAYGAGQHEKALELGLLMQEHMNFEAVNAAIGEAQVCPRTGSFRDFDMVQRPVARYRAALAVAAACAEALRAAEADWERILSGMKGWGRDAWAEAVVARELRDIYLATDRGERWRERLDGACAKLTMETDTPFRGWVTGKAEM